MTQSERIKVNIYVRLYEKEEKRPNGNFKEASKRPY
jgi:hypothetical protein